MEVFLYPRAAAPTSLRVWLCIAGLSTPPPLTWKLNGALCAPTPLRPLSSIRDASLLLPAGTTSRVEGRWLGGPEIARAFAGVYQIDDLNVDTPFTVTVEAGGTITDLKTRTLPAAIPHDSMRSFNVLLVSCFHYAEDTTGAAAGIVAGLKQTAKPDLVVLCGDQVYLDLPTLTDFADDAVWLADKFEEDYLRNWRRPFAAVHTAAPTAAVPDDHEYWNNFPHDSPIVQNSWSAAGRERWKRAAQATYDGFQLSHPAAIGTGATLDVPPLSFFFADTRSLKDPDRRFTMSASEHQRLRQWADDLVANRRFGVFVSGQSVLDEPAKGLQGRVGDYALPNYGDYDELVRTLASVADRGRGLLFLTGDVHWGRITEVIDARSTRCAMAEVISSPSSLVTTVFVDQAKELAAGIASIFGGGSPWPKHSDAADPPQYFAPKAHPKRFVCRATHRQRGNHVALLAFSGDETRLDVRVTYYPISDEAGTRDPVARMLSLFGSST